LIVALEGKWQINDDEGEYAFAGNVPGTVQGDLVLQELVPHPYVGLNEEHMRDLENRSWTYVKEFELDDLPAEENVELVFEGVDTLVVQRTCSWSTDSTSKMCSRKGRMY
jgi:beta-mannosidase